MAKVLVIEDDHDLRETICRGLRRAGHDPIEARNGREGVVLAALHLPALVITDIAMPERDGIEAIVELRERRAASAIIAMSGMTGRAGFDPLRDAQMLGADAVFMKPFALEQLLATAEMLLEPFRQTPP
jgi:CRP/FNR family transcriptional regulator, polysaccharide utilization system transcription regulator